MITFHYQINPVGFNVGDEVFSILRDAPSGATRETKGTVVATDANMGLKRKGGETALVDFDGTRVNMSITYLSKTPIGDAPPTSKQSKDTVRVEALAEKKAEAEAVSAIAVAKPISVDTTAPPVQVLTSIMICQHYSDGSLVRLPLKLHISKSQHRRHRKKKLLQRPQRRYLNRS